MKTLTLLRHAKSSWNDSVPRDFDRPLNGKGERAALAIGQHLRREGLLFDHVLSSPAVRCVETLEKFQQGYRTALQPTWDRRIYLASCVTLLDVIHDVPDDADDLLMVGHNPGLEDLVLLLVPDAGGNPMRDQLEEKFPTASVAVMTFDVARWADVDARNGTLTRFVRPRDLDPSFGPDQI